MIFKIMILEDFFNFDSSNICINWLSFYSIHSNFDSIHPIISQVLLVITNKIIEEVFTIFRSQSSLSSIRSNRLLLINHFIYNRNFNYRLNENLTLKMVINIILILSLVILGVKMISNFHFVPKVITGI